MERKIESPIYQLALHIFIFSSSECNYLALRDIQNRLVQWTCVVSDLSIINNKMLSKMQMRTPIQMLNSPISICI